MKTHLWTQRDKATFATTLTSKTGTFDIETTDTVDNVKAKARDNMESDITDVMRKPRPGSKKAFCLSSSV